MTKSEPMSLLHAIDAHVVCTICESPKRIGCACWVLLRCPDCGTSKLVTRADHDPMNAVVVEYPCPACDCGHEPDVMYFDATGQQV